MMICQELSSLAQAGSSAVVFVMSNRGYTIEQAFVDLNAFKPGGHFAPFDHLPTWDYSALASAFGAQAARVERVEELLHLLETLDAESDGPTLVEVVLSKQDLAPQLERLAYQPPTLLKYRRKQGHSVSLKPKAASGLTKEK